MPGMVLPACSIIGRGLPSRRCCGATKACPEPRRKRSREGWTMSGFREPEISREQMVLWSRRLDDAIPVDHPVRHMDELLHSEAFRDTFGEWGRRDVLVG